MTTLYAQPYDISAGGFYFDSAADYENKVAKAVNAYGQPVEEFEIQFIDGADIDCQLSGALGIHQGNIECYFDAVADWSEDDKIKVIIAVGEAGYSFDPKNDGLDNFEIELYECDCLSDLAMQFVDEGLYGEIPESIQPYIDYDAIAHDLGMDYAKIEIGSRSYIYRCG